jgi:hypothetical protein
LGRVSQLARECGLSREALYKALTPDGDPKLSTFFSGSQGAWNEGHGARGVIGYDADLRGSPAVIHPRAARQYWFSSRAPAHRRPHPSA